MQTFLAHCAAVFSMEGGMLWAFFVGGLTGSLTHCLTMCGPVVACQAACGGQCGTKLSTASQWHYHLGRMAMYGALGFLAALSASQIEAAPYWPTIASGLLVLAATMFLASALFPGKHRLIGAVTLHPFLRGILMSFMPCGLIYAALMMAATLANPWMGMVAMWLFVIGTLPALLLASGSAAALAYRWRDMMNGIGRFGMAFNGLALLVLATKLARI